MLDCPDLGWGSVVGNTLDRGVGYTPYGDHFMWQTGWRWSCPPATSCAPAWARCRAATPGSCSPTASGPYPDGLFTQSNLGIVTKMGIALMQRPPASTTFVITFDKEEDLEQVVDIMLPLRINMAPLQNVPVLRNIILDAGVVSKRTEWYDGDGPLPRRGDRADEVRAGPGLLEPLRHRLRAAAGHRHVPRDDQGRVPARSPARSSSPTTTGDEATDRGAHVLHDRHRINNGIPSLDEMKLLEWRAQRRPHRASRPSPRRTARTPCGSR